VEIKLLLLLSLLLLLLLLLHHHYYVLLQSPDGECENNCASTDTALWMAWRLKSEKETFSNEIRVNRYQMLPLGFRINEAKHPNKLSRLKNANWRKADQLATYKLSRPRSKSPTAHKEQSSGALDSSGLMIYPVTPPPSASAWKVLSVN